MNMELILLASENPLAADCFDKSGSQPEIREGLHLVPCWWRDFDAPGYNAIVHVDYNALPVDHPVLTHDVRIAFAPFSPTAPGRVGRGSSYLAETGTRSWVVVELLPNEE